MIKKNGFVLESSHIPQPVPSMSQTLNEVNRALKTGDQWQGLQSMSKQWNSIKNFSLLYSTLNSGLQQTNLNLEDIVNNFEETMNQVQIKNNKDLIDKEQKCPYEKVLTKEERQKKIKKYLQKKKNRKKKNFIRYEVRKTLANNRLRNKGKFIKNKKIDINKLIDLVKKGIIN